MLKKTIIIASISAAYWVQAQDVSTIKNTIDVYSSSINEGSAKYNAIAGANGALGGDASSLMSNPAGLGVAISSEITGTLTLDNHRNASTLFGNSMNGSKSTFNIGNVGGVAAFQLLNEGGWKFVNIGFNYSTESINSIVNTPGNPAINFTNATNSIEFTNHQYLRDGLRSKFNLGVGANYENQLYLGASLNFHATELTQFDTAEFKNTSLASNQAFRETYEKQFTPFAEKSAGFSMAIGAIGKLPGGLRLGASIESPTWWSIERTYDYYDLGGDGTASEERSLRTPFKGTISAGYVPNKDFSINVDYTLGLSKPHYEVQGDAERELNSFFKSHYKNTSEVKVGAEYRISDLRLRAGYAFASNPLSPVVLDSYAANGNIDLNKSYNTLISSSRNTIGLGVGYNFKSYSIDFAYQWISSKYSNPMLYGIVDAAQGINSAYYSYTNSFESSAYAVSDVKSEKNNFSLTFGWKF